MMKAQIYKEPVAVQETTSYRWDRILFSAVVFLLLLSGAIWGIWYWSSVNDDETVAKNVTLNERRTEPAEPGYESPFADSTAAEINGDKTKIELAKVENTDATEEPNSTENSVESSLEGSMEGSSVFEDSISQDGSAPDDASAPAESSVTTEESRPSESNDDIALVEDEPEISESVDENAEANKVTESPAVATVTIYSDRVLRAGVSDLLEDKELIGKLPATVAMNDEGLLRIYFFNEISGMTQQLYYHDWYRNDEREARVSIRPYTSPMRASSGKYVDRAMMGSWRVEAVTQDGEVLAEAQFEVVE